MLIVLQMGTGQILPSFPHLSLHSSISLSPSLFSISLYLSLSLSLNPLCSLLLSSSSHVEKSDQLNPAKASCLSNVHIITQKCFLLIRIIGGAATEPRVAACAGVPLGQATGPTLTAGCETQVRMGEDKG